MNVTLTKATIIIPTYNSHKTLGFTIEGLQNQSFYNSIEKIIIVDSSDNEESLKQLDEFKKNSKITVLTSGVRVMPAIQRNIGVKYANTDLLCFIDSDAVPAGNWVETIIKNYDSGIKVGGGSYRIPEFQKSKKIAKAQYYLEFNEYIDSGKPRKKKFLPFCNLFCDKSLFQKVGGIPVIRASEDTLFGLEVSKYEQIMFIPDISVSHIFREEKQHYFNNQVLLGKYIYIYRRSTYDNIYYQNILAYFFFPFFLSLKMIRILNRVFTSGSKNIIGFLSSIGLFTSGLYFWSKGFLKGISEYNKEDFVVEFKKNSPSLYNYCSK